MILYYSTCYDPKYKLYSFKIRSNIKNKHEYLNSASFRIYTIIKTDIVFI